MIQNQKKKEKFFDGKIESCLKKEEEQNKRYLQDNNCKKQIASIYKSFCVHAHTHIYILSIEYSKEPTTIIRY